MHFIRYFKRALWLSLAALLMIPLLVSFAQSQQPVFRIGVLDRDRGPMSNGARLAIQEINAAGGVRGADGTVFRLEIVTHPSDNLTEAAANINQASVIAVLGPENSAQVLSGLSTLQQLNVPVLTPAIGDTIIASDSSGRIFRMRAPEVLQGRALANYLVNDLSVSSLATVQLDLESTAGVIGFSTAISALGVTPQSAYLLDANTTIPQIVDNIIRFNLEMVAAYGPPDLASQLFIQLRSAGWEGLFYYQQAENPIFNTTVPLSLLNGVLSTTTWSYASTDNTSVGFLNTYAKAIGELPNAVAAASYDAIYLISNAIGLAGDLQTNLARLSNIRGVQGVLNPSSLTRGELSNNVAVVQMGSLGGAEVMARFAGSQRVPEDDTGFVIPTPTPAPTATPDGVTLTIKSNVQNIRTGPGLNYDVIGQLRQGEQARIIGATVDFSWVVIQYRGQQGWLAANLLDIFGDRSTIPVIQPPPTPTPGPPTATPTSSPIADIIVVSASPNLLISGAPFSVVVTIRNQGVLDAGPFAVAASYFPGEIYSAVNLPGLAAGATTTLTLTGTLGTGTGPQNIIIVADLNLQVPEGDAGEANNSSFSHSYMVDRPILNAGTLSLNPGGTLNVEGAGLVDLLWNGTGSALLAQNGAGMYLIPNVTSLGQIHYDLINPALATTGTLDVALLPNAYIGIITAEGNRAVVQVNSVTSGGPITLTYRVYQP